jgi:hypothetical protein
MRLLPTIPRNSASLLLLAAVLPVVTAVTTAAAVDAPPNPQAQAADAALADRFEGLAAVTFPAKVPSGSDRPYVFGEQAALLQAAATLDPAEARYPRKLAEALAAVGDVAGQYKALTAARILQPNDEFTWVKLIDLALRHYESADGQVRYLSDPQYGIETSQLVPPRVRSYAFARHARIAYDQGREGEARKLLSYALSDANNPLNVEALQLQYRLLPPTVTPVVRMKALLDLLTANPLQPAYARQAAVLAADAGLTQDALSFFNLDVRTSVAQRRPDLEGALDLASELYIANQSADAYAAVKDLLDARPDYSSAWYLRLLVVRSPGFTDAQQDQDLQQATIAMSNRVAESVNGVLDAAGPTTRPAGPSTRAATRPIDAEGSFPLPEVSGAAAILKDAPDGPPQLRQAFVEAVADLARLEIYFAKKPDAAAPLLDGLRQLLPAGDPLLAQLQGLSSLVAGDTKDAAATLAGVAKDDPLAAMGLVLGQWKDNPKDTEQADAEARKLIQDHPSGLVGAFLVEALVNPRVRLLPKGEQQPMQQLLASFPRDLFSLGVQPSRLYSVHVEPVEAGRDWGQPLLVQVTLSNACGADLTLGDDGMIRPGLLFQMTPLTAGDRRQTYPAYDTLAGPLVLHPREYTQQVVRVDQSALLGVLDRNVRLMFQVDGRMITNADTGVGGYVATFTKPFARTAVNVQVVADARKQLDGARAGDGSPRDRITAIGELQAYVREVRGARNQDPAVVRDVADLANAVHRARNDDVRAVAAWAAQGDFALSTDVGGRAALIGDLLASPDWRQRQLALVLVAAVPDPALQRKVIDALQGDAQPSVASYAKAAAALVNLKLPMNALSISASSSAPPAGDGRPTVAPDVPPSSQLPVPLP